MDEQLQRENFEAACEGFRFLARNAENERIRFRACEYLLPVPVMAYEDGRVKPSDLPPGSVPVSGDPHIHVTRIAGADIG